MRPRQAPNGLLRRIGQRSSVRARLLSIVLIAAIAFSAVIAVAALSSRTVGRAALQEQQVVALQERYLRSDAVLAKLRHEVHEVATSTGDGEQRDQAQAEYRSLRGEFEDVIAATLRDVPEGPLLAAAQDVAARGRAMITSADAALRAAPAATPAAVSKRLAELDLQMEALDEPIDALIVDLSELQDRAAGETTAAREGAVRAVIVTSAVGVMLILALALLTARSILRGLRRVADAAARLAEGDFDARFDSTRQDEIGALGQAFNATADSLRETVHRLEEQRGRDDFARQLGEALEMADTEDDTYEAVRRSLPVISRDHPAELLVADSSRAHLEVRAQHPHAGAPGCPVQSPFGCVAVRRGTTTTFADSRALNACPHLRDRGEHGLAAVCVPVTFMGRALGVLHTTAAVDAPPQPEEVARLATVAAAAGARIGTVRSFERTQLQASTDGLTGLMNRRSFETTARQLLRRPGPIVIVLADLDRFKRVNDTLGHGAGDQALAFFAAQLRTHLCSDDLVARYGGEEFVMLLQGVRAQEAVVVLDAFRARLAQSTGMQPPELTASFGVVEVQPGEALAGAVRRADGALYRAKAEGRDRVVVDATGHETPWHDASSPVERAMREDDPLEDGLARR